MDYVLLVPWVNNLTYSAITLKSPQSKAIKKKKKSIQILVTKWNTFEELLTNPCPVGNFLCRRNIYNQSILTKPLSLDLNFNLNKRSVCFPPQWPSELTSWINSSASTWKSGAPNNSLEGFYQTCRGLRIRISVIWIKNSRYDAQE